MEFDDEYEDIATTDYRLSANVAEWLAVHPAGLFEKVLQVCDGDFDEAERTMAHLRFQQDRERLELPPPTNEEVQAMYGEIGRLQHGRAVVRMITLGDLFVDIKDGELVCRLSPAGEARHSSS